MSREVKFSDQELVLVYQMLKAQQEDKNFEKSATIVKSTINNLVYKLADPVEDIVKEQDEDLQMEWYERNA